MNYLIIFLLFNWNANDNKNNIQL